MIYLDSMGHLYSTESLQELYDFAVKKLKLKPNWNHYSRHFPHFDLTTKAKQKQAIKLGAIFVDAREDIEQVKSTRQTFKLFYEEKYVKDGIKYFYECEGLYKQKILRIDFDVIGVK